MIIRPPYSRTCSESNKGEYYFSLAVKLSTGRELFKAIKCALGAHKIKRNKWHLIWAKTSPTIPFTIMDSGHSPNSPNNGKKNKDLVFFSQPCRSQPWGEILNVSSCNNVTLQKSFTKSHLYINTQPQLIFDTTATTSSGVFFSSQCPFGYFVANLRTFQCTFTGLNNTVEKFSNTSLQKLQSTNIVIQI